MMWTGHAERRGERRVWWGNMKERDHLEDLRVDRKIILKCIFREEYERVWTTLLWFSIRTSGGQL
jgi:hypothetical protein